MWFYLITNKKQSEPVTRCHCIGQWRTRFTLTSCCWGTCWSGRTCRTWRTWRRKRTTKTTEHSASKTWLAWWCRRENAGGWGQDANRRGLIHWLHTLTSCSLAERGAHADRILLCMFVGVNVGFSLLEKHRGASEADFPLPLAAVDAERDRLIFEKDEEVRFTYRLMHSFT